MAPQPIPDCKPSARGVLLSALWLSIALISSCATTSQTDIDYTGINPRDLLTVDCLLPPQLRQLGTRISYLAQRRATRTSAANCAMRGGEYVAYDKADFKSALKVWLPQALQGDPQAQTYVGEIHEKGLGTRSSYVLAAHWYQQAADQGYSRAQINLGYLYESGLGVERDLPKALNLYRQASGFTGAELTFVSSIEIANREAERLRLLGLEADLQLLISEMNAGRSQLAQLREQLSNREDELKALQHSRQVTNANDSKGVSEIALKTPQSINYEELIDDLEARLASANNQKKVLQDQLDHESLTYKKLRKKYIGTVNAINLLQKQLVENQQTIEQLHKQTDRHTETTAHNTEVLSTAEYQSTVLMQKIESLETSRLLQDEKLKTLYLDFNKLENGLNRKIREKDTTIQALTNQRNSEKARRLTAAAKQQVLLKQNTIEKQRLQDKYDSKSTRDDEKLLKLQKTIAEHEHALAQRSSEIDDLQDSLSSLQTSIQPGSIEPTRKITPAGPAINIIDPAALIARGSLALSAPYSRSADLIGKVYPFASLFSFTVNGIEFPVDETGIFRVDTSTFNSTTVELIAIDTQGASTRLEVSLQETTAIESKRTPLPTGIIARSPDARLPIDNVELGNYHALVIGNNTYATLSNLKTAGNDALAVEQILREKYGFKTMILLDANQKTILSALERMRVTLGKQDNLLIYYAGHGELDKQSGRGYWLPVDSQINSKEKWISNSAITSMIDSMNAKHVLVIADSCYSGSLTRSSIARPLSDVSAELRLKWLKGISQTQVRTVLSSGSNSPVLDGSFGSKHSIFAEHLLDSLTRNTEVLETYTLFFELQRKVAKSAAQLGVEQLPQYTPIQHAGHEAGEFIFVPIAQNTIGSMLGGTISNAR